MQFRFRILIWCIVLFISCSENEKKEKLSPNELKKTQENLVKAKKFLTRKESDEIDAFIAVKKWPVNVTGTGLRYLIINDGIGDTIKNDDVVKMKYKISLLDGTVCYTSDSTGLKTFRVGQDYVETGLHEGILFLKNKSKAKLILPSHLAHGLLGDYSKIPSLAPVIYDIEVVSVQKP